MFLTETLCKVWDPKVFMKPYAFFPEVLFRIHSNWRSVAGLSSMSYVFQKCTRTLE